MHPVNRALEILGAALVPFVEAALRDANPRTDWLSRWNASRPVGKPALRRDHSGKVHWSPDDILNTIGVGHWPAFRDRFKQRCVNRENDLSDVVKGWVTELREMRRRAMHQEPISVREIARFIDTSELLLRAAHADSAADSVHALHPYIEGTRIAYWSRNIEQIIASSSRIIVLDSYQGHKHPFWKALNDRMQQASAFDLIYLILRKGDPFLKMCLDAISCPPEVTEVDLRLIENVRAKLANSAHKNNKRLEFLYWEGFSPGPLLSWTDRSSGTETIGLGFWLQVEGATDNVPYIALDRGPLFESLKQHYEHIIRQARSKDACRIEAPNQRI